MKEMSMIQACIDFFGLKSGQDRMAFMRDEYKKLTDADRIEIAAGLEKSGYKITGAITKEQQPATA